MLTGTINFTGRTLDDCEQAIDEAKKRIMDTFTSGMGSNEDNSFNFEIDGVEEPVAVEA